MFYREVLDDIKPFIDTHDILLFYGSRQVGKSTLMKIIQKDFIKNKSYYFDLEEGTFDILNQGPANFIEYLTNFLGRNENQNITIFIDEIQYLDNPTSFLKYIYDHYENIKFIVSGSSTLEIRGKLKDSLAGRLLKFEIQPLSFKEFLQFKGKDNLANALGKSIKFDIVNNEFQFFYNEYMLFGGYPKVVLTNDLLHKKAYLKELYENYVQKDIKDIGKIRDVNGFNKMLKILAMQVGNILNLSELSSKVGVSLPTIKERILLLENTFIIKCITPFSSSARGELIKAPKLFFIDTGIRNYCANDFNVSGPLFENSFFEYIKNGKNFETINYYRTKEKQEIDFILDGKPFELKLTYNGRSVPSLNSFEKRTGEIGKIITLNKNNEDNDILFYPREI